MRKPQRWTVEHIEILRKRLGDEHDLTEIALALDRTRDAVYQKEVLLGLIKTQRRSPRPRVRRFARLFTRD